MLFQSLMLVEHRNILTHGRANATIGRYLAVLSHISPWLCGHGNGVTATACLWWTVGPAGNTAGTPPTGAGTRPARLGAAARCPDRV